MGLKVTILILGLFAMLLLVSSEVASTNSKEVTKGVEDAKYPGGGYGGGYPGGGYGGGYPGGGYGGGYPGYGVGYPGYGGRGRGYPGRGGGYRRGRYCGYGCCGGWTYNGVCTRCCSYAAEAVAAQTQDNTHN